MLDCFSEVLCGLRNHYNYYIGLCYISTLYENFVTKVCKMLPEFVLNVTLDSLRSILHKN